MNKEKTQARLVLKRSIFAAGLFEQADSYPAENAKENNMVSQIPVFPVGAFNEHHSIPEGFVIDSNTIDGFIETFNQGYPSSELPVYAGHGDGYTDRPAVGWVKQLINKGDKGLWAVVEWTYEGLSLIRDKAYKYISPEWLFEYTDPRDGKKWKNVLFAPALVNEPYFNMPTITASNKTKLTIIDNDMNLQELLGKLSELTDEEKAFVVEHKDEVKVEELSEEQKTAFEALFESEGEEKKDEEVKETQDEQEKKDDETTEKTEESEESEGEQESGDEEKADDSEDEGADEEADTEEGAEDEAADGEKVEGEEQEKATASAKKTVRITASRLQQLENDSKELHRKNIVASLKGIAPAVAEKATDFALNLPSQEMRDEFVRLITASKQEIKTERESKQSDNAVEYKSASEELTAVAKKRASKDKIDFGKAMDIVMKEDKALAAKVEAERTPNK